jgi:hypothetical protein
MKSTLMNDIWHTFKTCMLIHSSSTVPLKNKEVYNAMLLPVQISFFKTVDM